MGKSPKPLYIVVDHAIAHWDEFQVLREQGHTVVNLDGLHDNGVDRVEVDWDRADVVFSPRAWQMDPSLRKYLKLSIQAARAARYPPVKNKGPVT